MEHELLHWRLSAHRRRIGFGLLLVATAAPRLRRQHQRQRPGDRPGRAGRRDDDDTRPSAWAQCECMAASDRCTSPERRPAGARASATRKIPMHLRRRTIPRPVKTGRSSPPRCHERGWQRVQAKCAGTAVPAGYSSRSASGRTEIQTAPTRCLATSLNASGSCAEINCSFCPVCDCPCRRCRRRFGPASLVRCSGP